MTPTFKRLLLLGVLLGCGALLLFRGIVAVEPVAVAGARNLTWQDLLPEGAEAAPLVLPHGVPGGPGAEDPFAAGRQSAPPTSGELAIEQNTRLMDGLPQATPADIARPRASLDGETVAITGYMTPFNVVESRTRTFLLVPYVGACIHVPAPPANQIVLVETAEPVEVKEMWEPFTAVGKLRIENLDTGLAQTAYTMELDRIEPVREVKTGRASGELETAALDAR